MKHELTTCPPTLQEHYGFSWLEHVLAIPSPLVNVTTYKSNGLPNATMQSWCTFVGEDGYHVIFGSVNKNGHMYQSIKETNCCVVNFPSQATIIKCMATIKNNGFSNDEITLSGLTPAKAHYVNAPMIAECMANLECELSWEHDLEPGANHAVLCLKVVNVWMDERLFDESHQGRYGASGYLYNIHSPQNPLTGETLPEYIGTINKLSTYDQLN